MGFREATHNYMGKPRVLKASSTSSSSPPVAGGRPPVPPKPWKNERPQSPANVLSRDDPSHRGSGQPPKKSGGGYQQTLEEALQRSEGRAPSRQSQRDPYQSQRAGGRGDMWYYFDRPPSPRDPERDRLVWLADGILMALTEQAYHTPDGRKHDLVLRNEYLLKHTKYFAPGDPVLQDWEKFMPASTAQRATQARTQFYFEPKSTLASAREWSIAAAASANVPPDQALAVPVGVLNFASATKRGGGFRNGARAQEESLARASNLIYSLESPKSDPFYTLHRQEKEGGRGGYYTHAMIYSGSVALMRDDAGEYCDPLSVNMITSAAVNAGLVRRNSMWTWTRKEVVERQIQVEMRERMGRILRVFEDRGDKVLILGSFGTGVFQNSVRMVASIWAQHLGPGGRFHGAFDHVVFAILGDETFQGFRNAFKNMYRSLENPT